MSGIAVLWRAPRYDLHAVSRLHGPLRLRCLLVLAHTQQSRTLHQLIAFHRQAWAQRVADSHAGRGVGHATRNLRHLAEPRAVGQELAGRDVHHGHRGFIAGLHRLQQEQRDGESDNPTGGRHQNCDIYWFRTTTKCNYCTIYFHLPVCDCTHSQPTSAQVPFDLTRRDRAVHLLRV